jgi:hypothetical protein
MTRRVALPLTFVAGVLIATLVPALGAAAKATISVTSTAPMELSNKLPLLRLHFTMPTSAAKLPVLRTSPAIAVKWQQIGARDVQAVAVGPLTPSVTYTISAPTKMNCARTCTFAALRPYAATVGANVTLETQLLAELNYLPVDFTSNVALSDPTVQAPGTFVWKYADLPASLSAQWRVGVDTPILRGALMSFQNVNQLPTTGVADAATWTELIAAVLHHRVDPASYNYVVVSESSPQTTTLYVAGHVKFRTLANTGISVAPTATGTYPVYLRYATQTMSGTNPDGSHYSDPGIPWVSYFNGGDALHGFLRSYYGSPQSLGCVEMTFSAAKVIWPYTPIGTLVTVNA